MVVVVEASVPASVAPVVAGAAVVVVVTVVAAVSPAVVTAGGKKEAMQKTKRHASTALAVARKPNEAVRGRGVEGSAFPPRPVLVLLLPVAVMLPLVLEYERWRMATVKKCCIHT